MADKPVTTKELIEHIRGVLKTFQTDYTNLVYATSSSREDQKCVVVNLETNTVDLVKAMDNLDKLETPCLKLCLLPANKCCYCGDKRRGYKNNLGNCTENK
jgi:hypothetical protein